MELDPYGEVIVWYRAVSMIFFLMTTVQPLVKMSHKTLKTYLFQRKRAVDFG